MEPLAAAVVAISTVLATKALEKTGENVGQVVWDQTNQFVESLRNQSPDTVMAIEQAPEQALDYAKVALEVEAAAKQNPEVAQSIERLVTTVDAEALPNLEEILEKITKALESHQAIRENYNLENVKNFAKRDINQGNTNIGRDSIGRDSIGRDNIGGDSIGRDKITNNYN
ncbi:MULTISPECIES: hypothetical protein [unclassified Moorena]|uniref:hypothetical protein n=1 Tax=unclassified Moorena TaxID=2683338 RepID=UPI0013BB6D1F|nr:MULTISPECIES: hypothetical protein [unclassified Moorena]NEP36501.1 hypothetical protein [Moorena sp. SIO3B2]NEQ11738.1 hypothetical protein [Moorena sp. SIO4E2]NER87418.1 hypothetical protein [Moorena sp. SIO3A2]